MARPTARQTSGENAAASSVADGKAVVYCRRMIASSSPANFFRQAKPFRTGGKLHRRDAVTLERGGCAQCAGHRRRAEAELVDELP